MDFHSDVQEWPLPFARCDYKDSIVHNIYFFLENVENDGFFSFN